MFVIPTADLQNAHKSNNPPKVRQSLYFFTNMFSNMITWREVFVPLPTFIRTILVIWQNLANKWQIFTNTFCVFPNIYEQVFEKE